MISIDVLFGGDITQCACDEDFKACVDKSEDNDGIRTTKHFNTKAEKDAYLEGLADMEGWDASYVFSELDSKKIRMICKLRGIKF